MITVAVAVIERSDRRILIGQRRRTDTSPLKWEFPGGKVRTGETAEVALARELQEELNATLTSCVELGRVHHRYAQSDTELEILFFAASLTEGPLVANCCEQLAWVLPKELGDYDFLEANRPLIAQLATGRIKPAEILSRHAGQHST